MYWFTMALTPMVLLSGVFYPVGNRHPVRQTISDWLPPTQLAYRPMPEKVLFDLLIARIGFRRLYRPSNMRSLPVVRRFLAHADEN